jgi:ubiquinone/menaquinone biosynthesis C-methylase UbiE
MNFDGQEDAHQTRKREAPLDFVNSYEDGSRADAYARLEFANTYYLAYRDLPALLAAHVTGTKALDFGCGAGRSTRFLRALGFRVTGVDISKSMLQVARARDPTGDYRLVLGDNFEDLDARSFDLILAAFTFDNIPGTMKARIFGDLRELLAPSGTLVNVVSSPAIYTHEWASFTTKDFPANATARSGDVVLTIVTDHQDRRPVEDILCTDESYRAAYKDAGFQVVQVVEPLAKGDEPYAWVNETRVAPWVIYVLKRAP